MSLGEQFPHAHMYSLFFRNRNRQPIDSYFKLEIRKEMEERKQAREKPKNQTKVTQIQLNILRMLAISLDQFAKPLI